MTASDLYKRLQESHCRRESKRKTGKRKTTNGYYDSPLRNTLINKVSEIKQDLTEPQAAQDSARAERDEPRRQQMLKVLRASEARHKQKIQRDAVMGIGDRVTVLSGPFAQIAAVICDLDYINAVAMIEQLDTGERVWLNLDILAPAE